VTQIFKAIIEHIYKYTLEKTEGFIKNGQSRDTVKIGHNTQNKDKQKPTIQKTKKMNNTDPTKNPPNRGSSLI
jgi:hypothetical protein